MKRLLILVLLFTFAILIMAVTCDCQASSPMQASIVQVNTADALRTGRNCTGRLKVTTAIGGDSFANITCATWETHPVRPVVGAGIHMESVGLTGIGTYYDCWFLDEDLGQVVPYVELECEGALFGTMGLFDSGFENQ